MKTNDRLNDIHTTNAHDVSERQVRMTTANVHAAVASRPVPAELVYKMNDRATASGVLEQLAQWRREDNPRSASARTVIADRAVLVGLLILSSEDSPLVITRLAELFEFRIDPGARRILGLPVDFAVGDSPARATARWRRNTSHALHRLLAVLDPFPQPPRSALRDPDRTGVPAPHCDDREEAMKLRLDSFTHAFLKMTFAEQPERYRDTNTRIDITIADYLIPARAQNHLDMAPRADYVFTGRYSSSVSPRDSLARYRLPVKQTWGREASLAVRVDSSPSTHRRFPQLIVSATLHLPITQTAHTALTLMRGAISTGLRPGIVDADLGYFANNPVDKLHQPTFELGFTPSTDYKWNRLGVTNYGDGVIWVEGHAYCPLMPDELINATKDIEDGTIDTGTYRSRIRARTEFRLRTIGKPRKNGGVRMVCTCNGHEGPRTDPHIPSPAGLKHDAVPSRCTKTIVSVRGSDRLRRQAFRYGSPQWQDFHARARATAERVTARLKPITTANSHDTSGFAATQVFLTMALTTYNLRETAKLAELTGA
jgi:hypothetical protein